MIVCEALYYLLRFGSRLGIDAIASISFPVLVVAGVWFRVLIAHQSLYDAYYDAGGKENRDPIPEKVLNNLAYLAYAGLGLALFAVGSLYVGLAKAVEAVARR